MISQVLVLASYVLASACENPNVSQEWRELSQTQQLEYLAAIKCLRDIPSGLSTELKIPSAYHDLVYVHQQVLQTAHSKAIFLPWHRLFLSTHDDLLKSKCNYLGPFPYWDWSIDSQAPEKSPIWDNTYGFGGNGEDTDYHCLTGPFKEFKNLKGDCVARDWKMQYPDAFMTALWSPEQLGPIMAEKSFHQFAAGLESGPHNKVHIALGGNMANVKNSAEDPIFFMHHRNVDRIWWNWQQENPELANTFEGDKPCVPNRFVRCGGRGVAMKYPSATPSDMLAMHGLGEDYPVSNLLNSTSGNVNGRMCYTYSKSIRPISAIISKRFTSKIKSPGPFDRADVLNIRLLEPLDVTFLKAMAYSDEQIQDVRAFEEKIRNVTDIFNADPSFYSPVRLGAFLKAVDNNEWVAVGDKEFKEENTVRSNILKMI